MLNAFWEYIGFLGKVATLLIALAVVIGILASSRGSRGKKSEGDLKVKSLNDFYKALHRAVEQVLLSRSELKLMKKAERKEAKQNRKLGLASTDKQKVYVIDFKGDLRASGAESLRHEVTAALGHAKITDEVVVRLESPGGTVDGYGLASSQLARIREANIPLTICVDNVAASGGYMMACIGNRIMCAPFAVLGSIGVVAQVPNVNRLLKKHDIDVDVVTAGNYKRTMTVFGENTEAGKAKFKEEMEAIHKLFKGFVAKYRPDMDIEMVATGESWFGEDAINKKLADTIMTSDEYLQQKVKTADLIHLQFQRPKKSGLKSKIFGAATGLVDHALTRLNDQRI
jgi:serine protease SohB